MNSHTLSSRRLLRQNPEPSSGLYIQIPLDARFSSPFLGLKTTSNIVRDQVI